MRKRIALLLVVGSACVAARPAAGEEPRRQVIDLRKPEIEGKDPVPATMFIREGGPGAVYALFSLRRSLPVTWLAAVEKEAFDRETVGEVDRRER